jgi:hypothetical protein
MLRQHCYTVLSNLLNGESELWRLLNKWVLVGAPITVQFNYQEANSSVLLSLGLS